MREQLPMTAPVSASIHHGLSSKLFNIPVEIRRLYGGEPSSVPAAVRGVTMGLFQVSCPVEMTRGEDLQILSRTRILDSRVVECRRRRSGSFHLQIKLAAETGSRTEPRIAVNLPAKLTVAGASSPIPATLVDLSHSGMGLQLPIAISLGTEVYVDLGYATAHGEIRHCAFHIDHYRAGLRIHQFLSAGGALTPIIAASTAGSVEPCALHALMQTVQNRQLRYEAILCSLAFERKAA